MTIETKPDAHGSKPDHDDHHAVSVLIAVNEQPVTVTKHHLTGAEIKAAAIAQGVPIQPAFTLIEKRPGHASRTIGDQDEVALHDGQHFSCLPGDDNS